MKNFIFISLIVSLISCSYEPQTIEYNKDVCDFCKMTIVDKKFSTECISTKGKTFKFDDAFCLISFLRNGGVWSTELEAVYFSAFNGGESWIESDKAFFLKSELLHSPMGGNMAAFASKQEAEKASTEFNGDILLWNDIKPQKK